MGGNRSVLYFLIYVTVGCLYPAYCSMVAIETKGTKDDIAWLMYWVVFALFNFVEYVTDFLLSWFPLYPLCKLGFIAWCAAPFGHNGAFYVYKVFIQPFFQMYGGHISDFLTQAVDMTLQTANHATTYFK